VRLFVIYLSLIFFNSLIWNLLREAFVFRIGFDEDSNLLGCYAVSLGHGVISQANWIINE